MAAVTKNKPRLVSPPGYEDVQAVIVSEEVAAGDLLAFTGNVQNGQAIMGKAAAGAEAHAIALNDTQQGLVCDALKQGEVDGFGGLTPGAQLYLSGANGGELDDADGGGVNPAVPVRAITKTRVRCNFT